MKLIAFLVGFLFLFSFPFSFGQEKSFINGVLLDAQTNEPIVFATIRIKGKALGVISNLDGGFKIPEEIQFQGKVLEISSMGYETKTIEIVSLRMNHINNIYINPGTQQLEEAVVTGSSKRLTSKQIIRRALKKITENYPRDSFSLVGYYRDYQLKGDEYLNFNEAIVKVFDRGFESDHFKETQYGLLSYVNNNDFKVDSFAAKPYDYMTKDKFVPNLILRSRYRGNELVNLFIHNALRNYDTQAYSFIGVLTKDFIEAHRFSSAQNTSYGSEAVYKIDLKKKLYPFTVEGSIYIDKDDFAIRKLDYSLYGKRTRNGDYPVDELQKQDKNELLFEVLVEYSEVNEKMFLNYISLHNKFILVRPPIFKIKNLFLNKEEGFLDIELNASGSNYEDLELIDFDLKFDGRRLHIEKVVKALDDKITLKLSSKKADVALRNKLFSTAAYPDELELSLEIQKLEDEYGNKLEERNIESLYQFREFFTQKVIDKVAYKQHEKKIMIKRKPLNHVDQPILKSNDFGDYWMNTPLQKFKN